MDVFIATEIKYWDILYAAELRQLGYEAIQTTADKARGGVAVIYRVDNVKVKLITTITGTAILGELHFKNGSNNQKILLIASYINPCPDQDEKDHIKAWHELTSKYVTDSDIPMILTGDLNAKGNKMAAEWDKWGLTEQIKENTWWSGGNESKPDTMRLRSVEGTLKLVNNMYSDHIQV